MPPNSSMMTTRPFSVEAADTKGLWTAAARPTTRKGMPFSLWHWMVADPLSTRISPLAVLKVLLVSSFFWFEYSTGNTVFPQPESKFRRVQPP
eukprot:1668303-Amphidinium_carterae.1